MDTNLMLDSEWEDSYTALPEHARRELLRRADAVGVKARTLDPADFLDVPPPKPTNAEKMRAGQKAALAAREARIARTPITPPAMPSDKELKNMAKRLGVGVDGLRAGYEGQISEAKERERARREALRAET